MKDKCVEGQGGTAVYAAANLHLFGEKYELTFLLEGIEEAMAFEKRLQEDAGFRNDFVNKLLSCTTFFDVLF